MTQEDTELLLKDTSARLPYSPLISINGERYRMEEIRNALIGVNMYKITVDGCDIEYMDIKPYLFPLSSMTKEQEREWQSLMICDIYGILYHTIESFDYLYKNHIDIRGLIPKGLAIDATGLKIY